MKCLVLFRFARFALSGPVSGFVRPGTQSARPKTMEQVNVFSTNRNYFPNYFAAENDYGRERHSAPPFLTHPHTTGPPPIRPLTHSPIRANTCNSRLSRPAGPGPPPRRSSFFLFFFDFGFDALDFDRHTHIFRRHATLHTSCWWSTASASGWVARVPG